MAYPLILHYAGLSSHPIFLLTLCTKSDFRPPPPNTSFVLQSVIEYCSHACGRTSFSSLLHRILRKAIRLMDGRSLSVTVQSLVRHRKVVSFPSFTYCRTCHGTSSFCNPPSRFSHRQLVKHITFTLPGGVPHSFNLPFFPGHRRGVNLG